MFEKYDKKLDRFTLKETMKVLENEIFKDKKLMLSIMKNEVIVPIFYKEQILIFLNKEEVKKKNDEFFISKHFLRNKEMKTNKNEEFKINND